MKDHPCNCDMQIRRGAILLIVREIYCKKVLIQHTRILTSVITEEIRLFLYCTYQPKGKEKTEVSSNLYDHKSNQKIFVCIFVQASILTTYGKFLIDWFTSQ